MQSPDIHAGQAEDSSEPEGEQSTQETQYVLLGVNRWGIASEDRKQRNVINAGTSLDSLQVVASTCPVTKAAFGTVVN